MENKIIEDPKERIQMLADELKVTVNGLWPLLGYNNNSVLSSIMYGKTKSITSAFAENAIKHQPSINYLFLIKGELPVLNTSQVLDQLQQNMLGSENILSLQQIASKLDVISKTQIKILKKLEELENKK